MPAKDVARLFRVTPALVGRLVKEAKSDPEKKLRAKQRQKQDINQRAAIKAKVISLTS